MCSSLDSVPTGIAGLRRRVGRAGLVLGCLLLLAPGAAAQSAAPGLTLSAGGSALLYYSAFSSATSAAIETAVDGPIGGGLRWGGGARLGLGPARPEAFARATAAPRIHDWQPAAGLELGVTARGHYEPNDDLLGELQQASRDELFPLYVALHAAPLGLRLSERFRLSVLELQVGTHVAPLGRYVRLQLGLFSLGMVL